MVECRVLANDILAQQDYWTERRRATPAFDSDATGRSRRSFPVQVNKHMRILGLILTLAGCAWIAYEGFVFPGRIDAATNSRVELIERYDVQFTKQQAIREFRGLSADVLTASPRLWPGIVAVFIGTALLLGGPRQGNRHVTQKIA